MTGADLHTLTGAYAVNALPEDEAREFERHLLVCEACAHEVRELAATAERLGRAMAVVPPPEMKERVLHRISTVRQEPPRVARGAEGRWPVGPCAPPAAVGPRGVPRRGRRLRWCRRMAARPGGRRPVRRPQRIEQRAESVARVLTAPDAVVDEREGRRCRHRHGGGLPRPEPCRLPGGPALPLPLRRAGSTNCGSTTGARCGPPVCSTRWRGRGGADGRCRGRASGMGVTVEPAAARSQPHDAADRPDGFLQGVGAGASLWRGRGAPGPDRAAATARRCGIRQRAVSVLPRHRARRQREEPTGAGPVRGEAGPVGHMGSPSCFSAGDGKQGGHHQRCDDGDRRGPATVRRRADRAPTRRRSHRSQLGCRVQARSPRSMIRPLFAGSALKRAS